jgi:hypothetical protein
VPRTKKSRKAHRLKSHGRATGFLPDFRYTPRRQIHPNRERVTNPPTESDEMNRPPVNTPAVKGIKTFSTGIPGRSNMFCWAAIHDFMPRGEKYLSFFDFYLNLYYKLIVLYSRNSKLIFKTTWLHLQQNTWESPSRIH